MTAHIDAILASVTGILVTLVTLLGIARQIMRELRNNTKTTAETKELVNGHYTALRNYNNILIATLSAHGITVPPDPSGETDT